MNVTITEHEPVATVCGNEVRIYGGKEKNGVRQLEQIKEFCHRGAAVLYATEFDDETKRQYQRWPTAASLVTVGLRGRSE